MERILLCMVRKGGEGNGAAVRGAYLEERRCRVEGIIHYMRGSRVITKCVLGCGEQVKTGSLLRFSSEGNIYTS